MGKVNGLWQDEYEKACQDYQDKKTTANQFRIFLWARGFDEVEIEEHVHKLDPEPDYDIPEPGARHQYCVPGTPIEEMQKRGIVK